MKTAFRRLVRFKTSEGKIKYGEAPSEGASVGDVIKTYNGTFPWELEPSDEQAVVGEILCPLASTPIFYGIGLNYKGHIAEAKLDVPPFPTVFTKPPGKLSIQPYFARLKSNQEGIVGALAGPYDHVHVDPACQFLDHERELAFIVGKDVRNCSSAENSVEDNLLGSSVGNDVSSRYWQMPERSGGQHGYAKSFDQFGPIGPVIVSTSEIPDPRLDLKTTLNGEERQNSNTGGLLSTIPQILEHLSRRTTLREGTVVMTGTPSGVAAFSKPPAWLKDGDMVEIKIRQIGKIRDKTVIG
ncbi:hypothetical protein LTS17_011642 [Exophiala oligosperma]